MCVTDNISSQAKTGKKTKVLHLAGSTKNEFYFDLGVTYCRECDACPNLDRETFEFLFAIVHLDGTWSFPRALEKSVISESTRYSEKDALQKIRELKIDVMVPHMFCKKGATYYRSLFDKMDIPFVGNKESSMSLIDKAVTKEVLLKGGVQVPKGELLIKGQNEFPKEILFPCIVKPTDEDNSIGITLVKKQGDLTKAINYAFGYSNRVLVEEYIAGREMRIGIIEENDGSLTALPKIEYFVDEMRTSEDKLATKDGKLTENAIVEAKKEGDRQCPASVSSELERRINEQAEKAHKVMNCNDFSVWDVRVDENDQPFILESAFFCSFSPLSVLPALADKAGRKDLIHPSMFQMFLHRATSK